ncbi:hypothetical protein L2E82_40383 [Cichorium intybus]|uniref:Uncharacterized protein n=1 Tax=Cichorium intybus TaxID=13427 RepID=A0ACB9AMJ5_CICIN|nr:hypothetical protein L2E82_40383 [Cichorium intybus]
MRGGDDDSGEGAAAFLESDMNMQHAVSSYHRNKITNFMSPSSYYHNDPLHKHQASTAIHGGVVFGPDSGGATEASGKVLFTATQWQELERQTMIYKYIMASIPVPPHLLIPLSTHSNKGGMDMRFSSGSDPEPWRCRRTDGKKWRCSRDVAPDQKYCERHVHKSRPRSRKPVEIQPHNTNIITTSALNITPTAYTNTDMLSAATATSSYQHPSWHIPVSSPNQQFQQSMNSPKVGSKRNHGFPQEHESQINYSSLLDSSNTASSDASAGARRENFIDAWSRSGGGDNCSLTLSMQCSGGIDDNDQNFEIGVSGDVLKSNNQWLTQNSWMGSPPGGPLGEALGLGIVSTVKGPLNVPSTHGHSSSTATSSSCDNGANHGHELSFIR